MAKNWMLAAACAAVAVTSVACGDAAPSEAPTSWGPTVSDHVVWAVGDSQAANAGDPRRGPGWGERLEVGDGAWSMHGAGWLSPSTFTGETIPDRLNAVFGYPGAEVVIVMAGVNDLWNYGNEALLGPVRASAAQASASGVALFFVSVPPLPYASPLRAADPERLAFNAALASEHGERFIDCDASLVDETGSLRVEFAMAPDDLHLNDAGEAALANCIAAHTALSPWFGDGGETDSGDDDDDDNDDNDNDNP